MDPLHPSEVTVFPTIKSLNTLQQPGRALDLAGRTGLSSDKIDSYHALDLGNCLIRFPLHQESSDPFYKRRRIVFLIIARYPHNRENSHQERTDELQKVWRICGGRNLSVYIAGFTRMGLPRNKVSLLRQDRRSYHSSQPKEERRCFFRIPVLIHRSSRARSDAYWLTSSPF